MSEITTERAHALLSASSAERWLNCPPSARLESVLPDSESIYAAEGTLAHSIAELRMRRYITPMSTRTYNAELKKLQKESLYQPEMLQHVETYFDYIAARVHEFTSPPHIAIEKRLDFSHIVPEGFGTGDCILIGSGRLHIIDFKYGQGVRVDAERNSQMMLYALGALKAYEMIYNVTEVKMTIVQPRLNHVTEYICTTTELQTWGEEIRPTAQMAHEGTGELAAGDWCRFCRAKSRCRVRGESSLQPFERYVEVNPDPRLLSLSEASVMLAKAKAFVKWAGDLEEYVFAEALLGAETPGWKVVNGRSTRKFIDQDKAFAAVMASGINEAMLYERKPLTLTAVEKLLGVKTFKELLSEHVTNEPGKPTLVPESDKREAMKRSSAADDFIPIMQNEEER